MLAKAIPNFPEEEGMLFEPKWDGFRALVFRDGDDVFVQSRDKRPLLRYFPELSAPLLACLPADCVLDGEIVIFREGALDFGALQQRIHPAESRITRLAAETPAHFVAFDLLAADGADWRARPLSERRKRLEALEGQLSPPLFLTPMTRDRAIAERWFRELEGAGLDGIIAKPPGLAYQPKKRVMFKIKHRRTADCVVAGFRWHKNGPGSEVGSLLLGLYDAEGRLHHLGVASSFRQSERSAMADSLRELILSDPQAHPWVVEAPEEGVSPDGARIPGGVSRWSQGKNLDWVPLALTRVCEVQYDFLQGNRFRHATKLVRWRDDKAPAECGYDQLEQPPEPLNLGRLVKLA